MSLKFFCDGGARGNPGIAASTFIVFEGNKEIYSESKYLGITTNNVAEYKAVLMALEWLANNNSIIQLNSNSVINFFLDSELVVKQLNGVYNVKNKNILDLVIRIKRIIKSNNIKIEFTHVPREKNKLADKLVNKILDSTLRGV